MLPLMWLNCLCHKLLTPTGHEGGTELVKLFIIQTVDFYTQISADIFGFFDCQQGGWKSTKGDRLKVKDRQPELNDSLFIVEMAVLYDCVS